MKFLTHLIINQIGRILCYCPLQFRRLTRLTVEFQCFEKVLKIIKFYASIYGFVYPLAVASLGRWNFLTFFIVCNTRENFLLFSLTLTFLLVTTFWTCCYVKWMISTMKKFKKSKINISLKLKKYKNILFTI